jgi:ribonucleotide reductase beta subunit family protein with ferritin-like domain
MTVEVQMRFPDIWRMYKKMQLSFHRSSEDWDHSGSTPKPEDWAQLNQDEQHLTKFAFTCVFSFNHIFLKMSRKFQPRIPIDEVRWSLTMFFELDDQFWGRLNEMPKSYKMDVEEREFISRAPFSTIPSVIKKREFAVKWAKRKVKFPERYFAFSAMQRIFFCSSFAAIFWLKKRQLMPDLTLKIDILFKAMQLHWDFSRLLFSYVKNKPSRERVLAIIGDAMLIEQEFVTSALPVSLIGLNCDQMNRYVESVADGLLKQFGYDPHYNTPNPFDFIESDFIEEVDTSASGR